MQGKTAMSSAVFFDYSQIAFSRTSLSEPSGLNVHKGINSLERFAGIHTYTVNIQVISEVEGSLTMSDHTTHCLIDDCPLYLVPL